MFDFVFPQFFAGEVRKKLEEDMSTMKGNTMSTTADLEQGRMEQSQCVGPYSALSEAMQRADGVAAQMRPKEAPETSKISARLDGLLKSAGSTCSRLDEIENTLLGPCPEKDSSGQKDPHQDGTLGSINRQIDELEALLHRIHMTAVRLERV